MPLTAWNVGVRYLDIEAVPVLQKVLLAEKLTRREASKTAQTAKGISAAHLPQPTTIPLSKHTFCMTLH